MPVQRFPVFVKEECLFKKAIPVCTCYSCTRLLRCTEPSRNKPVRVCRRWFAILSTTCLWIRWLFVTSRMLSRNTWFLRYDWPAIFPSTGRLRFSRTMAKCVTCNTEYWQLKATFLFWMFKRLVPCVHFFLNEKKKKIVKRNAVNFFRSFY